MLQIIGFLIGSLGPPLAMYSYYFFDYSQLEFSVFIDRLLYSTLFAPVLSLCVLINLLFFFIFIWMNKDEASKGILLATIIYAFIIVVLKYF